MDLRETTYRFKGSSMRMVIETFISKHFPFLLESWGLRDSFPFVQCVFLTEGEQGFVC